MLTFFIWVFTALLVLDCLFLILLVLVQLPKKEAGAGLAFGGSATDALFGAGSGNVLTKITKWAAGIFFVLAILLAVLKNQQARPRSTLTLPPANTTTVPANPNVTTPTPALSNAPATSGENASSLLSTNTSSLISTNVSTNISTAPK
jgi:preprotein translocase subunit SecG